MGCCGTLVKYLLFIFNLIFVFIGIALIAIGSVILLDVNNWSGIADAIDPGLKAPQITLIVLGVFILVISFLGCCGAVKENKCMLITYGSLLIVIFIIQMVIGIYAVVKFNDIDISGALQDIFNKNTNDSNAMFDALQSSIKCCGVRGAADYGSQSSVPSSCCPNNDCRGNANFYNIGCAEKLKETVYNNRDVLGGIAIGLSIIEIAGSIAAFLRAKKSDRIY